MFREINGVIVNFNHVLYAHKSEDLIDARCPNAARKFYIDFQFKNGSSYVISFNNVDSRDLAFSTMLEG